MAGSDRVPDPNDSKRAQVGTRKPSTRAKWRSSMSAYRSVLENVLDTADIVRDDAKLRKLLHHAEHEKSPVIVGTEIVLCCQRIPDRLLYAFIVVAEKIQPDHVDVVRIPEVTHGRKGDVDDAVDTVFAAFLGSGPKHADHFVRNAADTNLLAQGEAARE